jgi:hypothetical protein
MKYLKLFILAILLTIITNCEKEKLVNTTTDARVVDFVAEKCYCCWGWVIEIGSQTIKADSLPGIGSLENIVFPFDVKIKIGNQTRDCSVFSKSDYYEIKECIRLK